MCGHHITYPVPLYAWLWFWSSLSLPEYCLNRNCHCVCSIQESIYPGLLSWFLLRLWFIEMSILVLRSGEIFFKILSITTMYLGHMAYVKVHLFATLSGSLKKFFSVNNTYFFLFCNAIYRKHLFSILI